MTDKVVTFTDGPWQGKSAHLPVDTLKVTMPIPPVRIPPIAFIRPLAPIPSLPSVTYRQYARDGDRYLFREESRRDPD